MSLTTIRSTLAAALALTACLACRPAAAQVTMYGLEHTPLGSATLTPNSGANTLRVSNLGSSGQDGVSIDVAGHLPPEGFEFMTTLQDLGPSTLYTPGAYIEQVTTLASPGLADRHTILRATAGLLGYDVSLDFSELSSAPVHIRYYVGGPGGLLVAEESVAGGGVVGGIQAAQVGGLSLSIKTYPEFEINVDYKLASGASAMRMASGADVVADYFVADVPVESISLNYTKIYYRTGGGGGGSGGITEFTITNESVIAVPEPSSLALAGIGAAALLFAGRRRWRKT